MKAKRIKLLSMATIIALLISCIIPLTSHAATTAEDVRGKIGVSSAETQRGQEVTIHVTATATFSVEDLGLFLIYDTNDFEFINAQAVGRSEGGFAYANDTGGIVKYGYANATPAEFAAGTEIFSVTFKIKDTATTDTLSLKFLNESGEELATGTITVDIPVDNVSLDKSTINLTLPGTTSDELTATVTPDVATGVTYTWSKNNNNVTISGTGNKVTVAAAPGVHEGSTIVTVTAGGKSASCTVNISTPLTGIQLNETSKSVLKGQKFNLVVSAVPEGAKLPNTAIEWESSDNTYATVENGVVTPLKATEGTPVTITAKVNGMSATCNVTITEIPLNKIEIDHSDFELFLGDSELLKIIFDPDNTTDDLSNPVWSSTENDIVSVDQNGMVTAKKIGEATISVTVAGKTASVKVTVPEVSIDNAVVKSNKTQLKIGEKGQLHIETNPSRVTEQVNVVYKSSNGDIVSVDENGVIKGLKAGKATITAVVNGEFTSEVEIEVLNEVYVEKPADTSAQPAGTPAAEANNGGTPAANPGPSGILNILPNTGDIAIGLFVTLMIVSLTGMIFIVIKNKKIKNKKS